MPPSLNEDLYYTIALDIQGKVPFGSGMPQPKSILLPPRVLGRMHTPFFTMDKIIIFSERLQELQKRGHEILLYNVEEGKIVPLHPKIRLREMILGLARSPQESENQETPDPLAMQFKTIMTEQGINPDQCLIFAEDYFDELLQWDNTDWDQLSSFETINLNYSNLSLQSLEALLRTHGPKIRSLSLRYCLNLGGDSIGDIPELNALETLIFGGRCLIGEYTGRNSLSMESIQKILSQANALRTIDLSYLDRAFYSLGALKHPEQLINLDLSHNDFSEFFPFNTPSPGNMEYLANLKLDQLESLNLNNSKLGLGTLISFIKKTHHLKKLELEDCNFEKYNDGIDELPESLDLSHLETLTLVGGHISLEVLGQFLHKSPHLKTLLLKGCKFSGEESFESLNLAKLETVDLSYTTVTIDNLQQIIGKTQQLKTLNLSGCKKLSEGELPDTLDLTQLEMLGLKFSKISSNNLAKLIRKAQPLKALNVGHLGSCTLIDDGPLLDGLNLSQLEKLDLTRCTISLTTLGKLIGKSSHLHSLNLDSCSLTEGAFPETLTLPKLETLNLHSSCTIDKELVKLINKSPLLQTLSLSDCTFQEGILAEPLALSQLKTIRLICEINLDNLGKLLHKAHQLRQLDLGNCTLADSTLSDSPELYQLESLRLRSPLISLDNLGKFVHKSNLKILEVTDFEHFLDGVLPDSLKLPQLEQLTLRLGHVSLETLGGLLQKTSHLNSLSLTSCKFSGVLPHLTGLFALEKLWLRESKISSETLCQLIHNANQLKFIRISIFQSLDGVFPLPPNLSQLEELQLLEGKISIGNFGILIQKACQLKQIDLCNVMFSEGVFPESLALPQLKIISLYGCKISFVNLSQLIKKAPDLEKLYLDKLISTGEFPESMELPQLKELVINRVSMASLGRLIDKASQLEKLVLGYFNDEEKLFNTLKLSKLKILILGHTVISVENLAKLLINAQQIQEVVISDDCTIIGDCTRLQEILKIYNPRALQCLKKNTIAVLSQDPDVVGLSLEESNAPVASNKKSILGADTTLDTKASFTINVDSLFAANSNASLVNTIDSAAKAYLKWRSQKGIDDGRGYPPGFFTRLRHYTKFGEERGQQLIQHIQGKTTQELYQILVEHLSSKHSKLHNHSLDTYLLEQLKPIFPSQEALKTISSRERYRDAVLKALTQQLSVQGNKPG